MIERQHLAPCRDPRRRHALAEIFLERLNDFGLGPIALDDDGAGFFDADEGFVDDLGADAAGDRFGADAGEKLREGRTGSSAIALR